MAVPLQVGFAGRRSALFSKALKLSLLTVLTLGMYRFWMKTRLRRWYWSAIRPGGHPLEYTGAPLEKLLGFLIAVVFLAFYIGVVNLILMFVSFSLFQGNTPAYFLSLAGVVPLVFYAQYRARRYILARTRWRGIRFGLEEGAWGYARRAMLYWTLTLLSAGLLWPLMTFRLEAYRTNRTWFGSAKLHQDGRWVALILPAFPGLLMLWASAGFVAFAVVIEDPLPAVWLFATVPLTLIGYIYYQTRALRYLTSHKTAGDAVRLSAEPRVGRVLGIQILGNLLVLMGLSVVAGSFALVFGAVALSFGDQLDSFTLSPSNAIGVLLLLIPYFAFFVLWDVLRQVFVRMPLLAHYAQTLQIENPHGLASFDQRARDEMPHAEGFADALDVGAAL